MLCLIIHRCAFILLLVVLLLSEDSCSGSGMLDRMQGRAEVVAVVGRMRVALIWPACKV